ncbi:MAG: DUF2510 domain-containing protein [Candidatus Microthrix sp.]|nr:DUF2510 domain-containing protein [Candidatus Microthrix sp.]
MNEHGDLVCWKCGSKNLLAKRTTRSKVVVGVGALATKKKLKCMACGEYNDVGNAKPTASAKAAQQQAAMAAYMPQPAQQPAVDTSGRGWHRDPVGRFHQRFFDGAQWTQHVTDGAGVQQVDPGPINTI